MFSLASLLEGFTGTSLPDEIVVVTENKTKDIVKAVETQLAGESGSAKKKAAVMTLCFVYDIVDAFANIPDLADDIIKKFIIPGLVEMAVLYFNVQGWDK
jgi:hypothetical protein